MLKNTIQVILFLCLFFTASIHGQQNWCGTVHDHEAEKMLVENLKNKKKGAFLRSNVQKYVPVTITMIADASGNGRVREEKVLEQIASLNDFYAESEITFFIKQFKYFDNNEAYQNPGSGLAEAFLSGLKDNASLNIFIANTANNGGNTAGTVLAYWTPGANLSKDWIVSRKAEINGGSSTMAHEIGHFFSVAHPHLGWECFPYDDDEYGNPVTLDRTRFINSNGDICASPPGTLIELVDGSNCATAADRLCDTPADYNFALGPNAASGCNAPGNIQDKNGDIVMPMVNNVMGYYNQCSEYVFSDEQKQLIQTSYASPGRFYIRNGVSTPNLDQVDNNVNYIYPLKDGESNEIEDIVLDWEDVSGANKYLVIIDRFSSFSFSPQRFIVEDSELMLPDPLQEGFKYFWRVWPYNESETGAGWGETQNFTARISTSIPTIKEIDAIAVYPNPLNIGQDLMIQIEANEGFQTQVELIDLQGRVVKNYGEFEVLSGSQNNFKLPADQLTAGLYLLKLSTQNGTLTKKISIE